MQYVALIRRRSLRRRVPITAYSLTAALARAELALSRRHAERLVLLYEIP